MRRCHCHTTFCRRYVRSERSSEYANNCQGVNRTSPSRTDTKKPPPPEVCQVRRRKALKHDFERPWGRSNYVRGLISGHGGRFLRKRLRASVMFGRVKAVVPQPTVSMVIQLNLYRRDDDDGPTGFCVRRMPSPTGGPRGRPIAVHQAHLVH
jgi:hypothetical protein